MFVTLYVIFFVLLSFSCLSAMEPYVVTSLPDNTDFKSLNMSGQVVGATFRVLEGNKPRPTACVWDAKDGLRTIDEFADTNSYATAINDNGEVAGYTFALNSEGHCCSYSPFRWKLGEGVVVAPELGFGTGINNLGDIVGYGPPFLWKASGEFELFPKGCFLDAYPKDINDQGNMPDCNQDQVFDVTGANSLDLVAINENGDSVGNLGFRGDDKEAVRYQPILVRSDGQMIRLASVGSYQDGMSRVDGINDLGDIVGRFYLPTESKAIVWIDGKEYDLNEWVLNDSPQKITLTWAIRINNLRQILAYGYVDDKIGETRQFLLTLVSQTK